MWIISLGSKNMRTVPCTWSRGSKRFFSAGIYFNTTVSSPLYCIVVSKFSSIYRKQDSIRFFWVWLRGSGCQKGWFEALPWAAARTTPLSECQAPRCRKSTPPLPGICSVRSDRGATQRPADSESPAESGWWHTAKNQEKPSTLSASKHVLWH